MDWCSYFFAPADPSSQQESFFRSKIVKLIHSRISIFSVPGDPRLCVLHKGKKGFGFVLRGAKAASPLMEMIPSDKCPGLQYLDDVDPGGVADMAGVRKGDFVLEVSAIDLKVNNI